MEAAGFDLAGGWMTAENIAYVSIQGESDLRDEIRQLHQNLMDSPGHYRNIMSDAAYIGIGLEVGYLKVNGRDYKVLMRRRTLPIRMGRCASIPAPSPGLQSLRPTWRCRPARTGWKPSTASFLSRPDPRRTRRATTIIV